MPYDLIRDGAKLVESVDDVLEELGPLVERPRSDHAPDGETREIRHPVELPLNEPEQPVLAPVGDETITIDAIVAASGLPVPHVLSIISVLEMHRLIRRVGGSQVRRAY